MSIFEITVTMSATLYDRNLRSIFSIGTPSFFIPEIKIKKYDVIEEVKRYTNY